MHVKLLQSILIEPSLIKSYIYHCTYLTVLFFVETTIFIMIFYNIIASMCFAIPMVFTYTYNHTIHLSMKSDHQASNGTINYCNSLNSMFTLLSDNKESTDVFIQSGNYTLNTSYTLEDLHNIRIGSNASNPAIIMCISDLDTGVAFLRASDLTIDHLSIVGCGMKHNSTNYLNGKGNLISACIVQCLFKTAPT